jgi:hypothetical protein
MTLIEVLCVTAIAAIMMGALLGTVTITARGTKEVRSVMRLQRTAGGIERILREDLALVCALRSGGVQTFVGRAQSEYAQAPVMEFFTLNSLANDPEDAMRRVSYSLKRTEEDGELLETFDLFREERPWRARDEAAPAPAERLASGIQLFSAQYYDGTSWHDQWQLTTLPDMVRVNVTLGGEDERTTEETFIFCPYIQSSEDPTPRR